MSLKAGGTGLNLTAANHVIHYDLWWNPAVEAQATDRAYRIGQERNVMVYRLLSTGTFEERIDEMIQSKKELANLTISSGESWITEFNNDQLRDLVNIKNAV
ncbi:helicase-related protein [Wolbachia endosymbiont of Cantharis cryptica]|uniref:helicase-related protein n=1 Tax=Wolbachia endosymbiont of Cantharis cryptica TaxID=3066132 RepID=UPI00376ECEF7